MKRITWVGGAATGLYFLVVSAYVWRAWPQVLALEPNELGDFLAGTVGPVAFFWLICGYLQQGVELRQNTRALELQAEELRNSVDQQRQMVLVSREQLAVVSAENRRLQETARIAVLPIIIGKGGGAFSGDGRVSASISLTNVGAEIRHIVFDFEAVYQFRAPSISVWERDKSHSISWIVESGCSPKPFSFAISYLDAHGVEGRVRVDAAFTEEEPPIRFATHLDIVNPM